MAGATISGADVFGLLRLREFFTELLSIEFSFLDVTTPADTTGDEQRGGAEEDGIERPTAIGAAQEQVQDDTEPRQKTALDQHARLASFSHRNTFGSRRRAGAMEVALAIAAKIWVHSENRKIGQKIKKIAPERLNSGCFAPRSTSRGFLRRKASLTVDHWN